MKKYWISFLLFFVVFFELQSQNKFSYWEYLPVYSIANDTLETIVNDFITVKRENTKKNIVFFYIGYYPDSTYDVTLYLTEKSLLYDNRSFYKHDKCQQFMIEYKNYFIPAYLEKYPRDINRPKDTSFIEIPFLHQTTKKLHILIKEPPKGYYDNTYLGEGVLEKWIMSWNYKYEGDRFRRISWTFEEERKWW